MLHPLQTWGHFKCRYVYPAVLRRKKGLILKGRLLLTAYPLIDIRNGASITLENEVMLDSRNKGYHLNMHSPCKLFANRPGAEIVIGEQSRIHGTCVHAYERVTIGKRCLIGANSQIMDGSGHDLSFPNVQNRVNTRGDTSPVAIEDDVWFGADVYVLPGVTIGKGAVIAAGSVVTRDIPPMVVAAGNPAKVVKDCSNVGTDDTTPPGADTG